MDNILSKWTVDDAVGAAWLADRYGVDPVQPLRVLSRIGRRRSSQREGNRWQNTYEERYRPAPTFGAHFEFMLRHEYISLEFLARLYDVIDPNELIAWLRDEPSGRYARRAGFLYEWLTLRDLDFSGVTNGVYVEALEKDRYLTAFKPTTSTRWHVKNNLPGDQTFCPIVVLTDVVSEAIAYDVAVAWSKLEDEFGAELIRRSSVWITIKESRSSFAIEGEGKQTTRIRRFAHVMEAELGHHDNVFTQDTLNYLQRAIIGDTATRYGIRRSPIFVGETRGAMEIVHYIAPHWDVARAMLGGLAICERLTRGSNPLLRAAVLSFGFVYAHPLTDGNGRISRFLVNDVLRRDGVLPEPFVLPVSAVISSAMRDYDRTLEILSKPLMRSYSGAYQFGKSVLYDDGLTSTLHFEAYGEAEPVWRYPDLTDHVQYLCDVVKTTIDVELREEATQMRAYRSARRAVNEIIEGPDEELDRIVRSVSENGWKVSAKLRSEFPLLASEDLVSRLVEAVRESFKGI